MNSKIQVKETSPGHIDVTCDCGKAITEVNEFGMFCEDFCGLAEAKQACDDLREFIAAL